MGNLSDKDIKDLIQNRELTPSLQSWDKLDTMLNTTKKDRRLPFRKVWSIAASFLVIGLLTWLWVGPTSKDEMQSITHNQQDTKTEEKHFDDEVDKLNIIDPKPIATASGQESKEIKPGQKIEPQIVAINSTRKIVVSDVNTPINNKVLESQMESKEIEEGHAVSKNIHTPDLSEEADSLLWLAQSQIKEERSKILQDKYKINSEILLAEAEKRSEETFLKKLVKNVQSTSGQVITAVVNRNYAK